MNKQKRHDQFKEFRALSKEEQREHILDITFLCIDGASVSLARKIEIYLDATDEEMISRHQRWVERHGP